MALAATLCNRCDKTDTDPMVHVSPALWEKDAQTIIRDPSFHFDCLPDEFRAAVADGDQHENIRQAIEAADSGINGGALRSLIAKQTPDPDPEPDAIDTETEDA